MAHATGTFNVLSGHEDPYRDLQTGGRLARAGGTQRFSGGITGDGVIEWLICYGADRAASLVGLQLVDGTLDGRHGSFVIESIARHDGTASAGTWRVVEGSGSGELVGLTGRGSFRAPGGRTVEYELDYELAVPTQAMG
jgi:hypothetical protein